MSGDNAAGLVLVPVVLAAGAVVVTAVCAGVVLYGAGWVAYQGVRLAAHGVRTGIEHLRDCQQLSREARQRMASLEASLTVGATAIAGVATAVGRGQEVDEAALAESFGLGPSDVGHAAVQHLGKFADGLKHHEQMLRSVDRLMTSGRSSRTTEAREAVAAPVPATSTPRPKVVGTSTMSTPTGVTPTLGTSILATAAKPYRSVPMPDDGPVGPTFRPTVAPQPVDGPNDALQRVVEKLAASPVPISDETLDDLLSQASHADGTAAVAAVGAACDAAISAAKVRQADIEVERNCITDLAGFLDLADRLDGSHVHESGVLRQRLVKEALLARHKVSEEVEAGVSTRLMNALQRSWGDQQHGVGDLGTIFVSSRLDGRRLVVVAARMAYRQLCDQELERLDKEACRLAEERVTHLEVMGFKADTRYEEGIGVRHPDIMGAKSTQEPWARPKTTTAPKTLTV